MINLQKHVRIFTFFKVSNMWPEGLGPAEGLQCVKNRSEVSELFQFYIKYNDARNDVVPVQQGGANGLLQGLWRRPFPSLPFLSFL